MPLVTLLFSLRAATAATCPAGQYSYGSGGCSPCAAGAAFVSAAAGCAPSAAVTAGPSNTAFYLSGSSAEGVGALAASPQAAAAATFAADAFGGAGGALAMPLASGSFLTAAGSSAPAAMPSGGNVAWSASAWVKCAAPTTWADVLEWGAAGDAGAGAIAALALDVVGSANAPFSGLVTTIAGGGPVCACNGPGSFGTLVDGTGMAARFMVPESAVFMPVSTSWANAGDVIVGDQRSGRVRIVSPAGVVATFSFVFLYPVVSLYSSTGKVLVADNGNNRVCLISFPRTDPCLC